LCSLRFFADAAGTPWFSVLQASKLLLGEEDSQNLKYACKKTECKKTECMRSATHGEAPALKKADVVSATGASMPLVVTAGGLVHALHRFHKIPYDAAVQEQHMQQEQVWPVFIAFRVSVVSGSCTGRLCRVAYQTVL
jgi:hypothetical protein